MTMPLAFAAALLGFLAVALGAFGVHGLKDRLAEEALGWWETATLYALVHAAAALAIGLHARAGLAAYSGWAMCTGIIVFSGSLYAMALGAPRWLGAVTPLGGAALLLGWVLVAAFALRQPG